MKCRELIEKLENFASKNLAEDWDNPGLIVGELGRDIKKVLVALDATEEVIDEAIEIKANIIITHHPLLFSSIKKITDENTTGIKLMKLIKNNIAHFAIHTNLDIAFGGTNDVLAEIIGLKDLEVLSKTEVIGEKQFGLGRIGNLETEESLEDIARRIKVKLGLDAIRFVGDKEVRIKRIGLCTGSGIGFLEDAKTMGADAFVTSDIRYHESQKALDMGMCIIDATHYGSENIIVPRIAKFLRDMDGGLKVNQSKVNGQVFKHL